MIWRPSSRQVAFGGTGVSVLGSTIAPADADGVVRPTVPLESTSTTAAANASPLLSIFFMLPPLPELNSGHQIERLTQAWSATAPRLVAAFVTGVSCVLLGGVKRAEFHHQASS